MKFKVDNQFPSNKNVSGNDLYETFNGYQFFSLYGILLWGGIGFIVFMYINSSKPEKSEALIVSICFSIFLFIFYSWQMNYFQVSESHLRISKHNLFWKKTTYNLSDIQEVILQQRRNSGNCIKVITSDFKSKYYVASVLTEKTFLNLKDKLESYNVKVIDERH